MTSKKEFKEQKYYIYKDIYWNVAISEYNYKLFQCQPKGSHLISIDFSVRQNMI